MTPQMSATLEAIAHEKYMARSLVAKCQMIETLIRQNHILQEDAKRLQEAKPACQEKQEMSS